MAVGVGSQIDDLELKIIAMEKEKNKFHVSDFNKLIANMDELLDQACKIDWSNGMLMSVTKGKLYSSVLLPVGGQNYLWHSLSRKSAALWILYTYKCLPQGLGVNVSVNVSLVFKRVGILQL